MRKIIVTPNLLRTLGACAPLLVTLRAVLAKRKKEQEAFTVEELCSLHTAHMTSYSDFVHLGVAKAHNIGNDAIPAWRRGVFQRILQEDHPDADVRLLLGQIPWLLARVGGDYKNIHATADLISVHTLESSFLSGANLHAHAHSASVLSTQITHCTLHGEWFFKQESHVKNVLTRNTELCFYGGMVDDSTLRGGSASFYDGTRLQGVYFRGCVIERWDDTCTMSGCLADERTVLPKGFRRGKPVNGMSPISAPRRRSK